MAAVSATPTLAQRPELRGLSADAVAERVRLGQVNRVPSGPTRTVADIVRANVFTRFNLLLGALVVVALLVSDFQDALFGGVLVVNAAIGIVQEVRAKRTLERLALLSAPRVRLVRDAVVRTAAVEEVVLDDVIRLEAGDQIVVDGDVLAAEGLEVDESLLTGESDPVVKAPGDRCRSGSFVVAGSGYQWAQKVGADAYASQLAAQARRFTLVSSELRAGIDTLLRIISWLLVPAMVLVFWSQLRTAQGIRPSLAASVAGVVGMVPQGLVLLTSMAFAVAVVRLGRRNVVVQELPAVEGLARVDVVCLDKTGTLTEGRLRVQAVEPIDGAPREEVESLLAAVAAGDPAPNATMRALQTALPEAATWPVAERLPFSSARKYTAVRFEDHGTVAVGAPEVLLPPDHPVLVTAERHAAEGRRVLLVARGDGWPAAPGDRLEPVGLVVVGDELRPDAGEILQWLRDEDVTVKVISGDHPRTVAAVASRAGVLDADRAVDGRALPEDPGALADAVEANTVFGRVTPEQKQRMVAALQERGHVVAMTGDGVNDVLALKDADLGIAMGSGSPATRAVAQLVLLDSDFAAIPAIVAEGRRVIANIERVANLFLTKTVYAFVLAVAVGAAGLVFPFLPRHLTLIGSLTIGIPGFVLALEPTSRRYRAGFVSRVLRFAIPTGTVAAAAAFGAYWLARDERTTLMESRTIATLTLGAIGAFALVLVSRPLSRLRRAMLAGVAGAFVLVVTVPAGREFFALDLPRPVVVLAAVGIAALTGTAMWLWLGTIGWLATIDLAEVGEAVATSRRFVRGRLRVLVERVHRRRRGPPD